MGQPEIFKHTNIMAKVAVRGMAMLFLMTVAALALFDSTVAQTTHQVGDSLGWILPPSGDADYVSWASTKTFTVGDILVFNFATGTHSVAAVSKEDFGSCNTASPISISTTGPTSITLSIPGEHFYICTFPGHCDLGQKLVINVSTPSSPPAPLPVPGAATPLVPVPNPIPAAPLHPFTSLVDVATLSPASGGSRVYNIGNGTWTVPQTGPSEYQTWTRGNFLKVGDILEFDFANETHNVAEVSKSAFDSCDISSPLFTLSTSPARITLRTSGEHYYICTFPRHCSLGQKLAVNVALDGSGPAPSASATTPPSSIAIPPFNGFGPSGDTNPESPAPAPVNSAPSSVAALPITLLSIAFAYLY